LEQTILDAFESGGCERRNVLGNFLGAMFTRELLGPPESRPRRVRVHPDAIGRDEIRVIAFLFAANSHSLLRDYVDVPAVTEFAWSILNLSAYVAYASLYFLIHVRSLSASVPISEARILERLRQLWEDEGTRKLALILIRRLKLKEAVEDVRNELVAGDVGIRREALATLVRLDGDSMERALLSMDLDGFHPFLDPSKPVTAEHIRKAQEHFFILPPEMLYRFYELADKFGLVVDCDEDDLIWPDDPQDWIELNRFGRSR
jgi:hypothetical protein